MVLNVGKSFDEAFGRLRDHFWLLFGIGLVFFFIPKFMISMFQRFVLPLIVSIDTSAVNLSEFISGNLNNFFMLFGIGFALGILGGFFQLIFMVIMIKVFSEKRLGRELPFGEAIARALPFIGIAILLWIVQGIATFFLLLLLIIPGIIFGIYWMFSTYAVVIDKKGVFEALGFSMELVKGNWWILFGLMLLFIIASMGLGILIGIPLALVSLVLTVFSPVFGAVFSDVFGIVFQLILIIFLTSILESFYMDLRAEKGYGKDSYSPDYVPENN